MLRKTTLATCLFLATTAQAQTTTALEGMPSSEILAEVDYLTQISPSLEVNQITGGLIERVFSAISLCEEQPIASYADEVNDVVALIGAATGVVLRPNVDRIHTMLSGKTGCGHVADDITELDALLADVELKLRIDAALKVRYEVMNDRVVPATALSELATVLRGRLVADAPE